jgi:hypothetical protein
MLDNISDTFKEIVIDLNVQRSQGSSRLEHVPLATFIVRLTIYCEQPIGLNSFPSS